MGGRIGVLMGFNGFMGVFKGKWGFPGFWGMKSKGFGDFVGEKGSILRDLP